MCFHHNLSEDSATAMTTQVNYLRLMKYPGAKTSIIPDIDDVFKRSGKRSFVDVFGGSGSVSLNMKFGTVIYNDLDPELVNLFRAIQHDSALLVDLLYEALDSYEFRRGRKSTSEDKIPRSVATMKPSIPAGRHGKVPDVGAAAQTILRFTMSFGGMGDTYGTKEKAAKGYLKKTISMMQKISEKVSGWTIENLDFRTLINKYDSNGTFFYLDPPYSERNWYGSNFRETDYEDLRDLLKNMKGKYLLTVDAHDDLLEDIFGDPDYIKAYENRNQDPGRGTKPPRTKAFYTNV